MDVYDLPSYAALHPVDHNNYVRVLANAELYTRRFCDHLHLHLHAMNYNCGEVWVHVPNALWTYVQ